MLLFIIFSFIAGAILIVYNLPIAFIILYLLFSLTLIYYSKKIRKDEHQILIIVLILCGLIFYACFLSPNGMIIAYAKRMAQNEYKGIYGRISFDVSIIKHINNRMYYIYASVYSGGKFLVGRVNFNMEYPLIYPIISWVFLGIIVLAIFYVVYVSIKDGIKIPKTMEFIAFRKEERKRIIAKQVSSYIYINFFVVMVFIFEKFNIYGYNDDFDSATYIACINTKDILINGKISSYYGMLNVNVNFWLILFYSLLILSVILFTIAKSKKYTFDKKSTIFMIISMTLCTISMIGLCFTNSFINIQVDKIEPILSDIGFNYINYQAIETSTFFIVYKIIMIFVVNISYLAYLFYNFKIKKMRRKIDEEKNLFMEKHKKFLKT